MIHCLLMVWLESWGFHLAIRCINVLDNHPVLSLKIFNDIFVTIEQNGSRVSWRKNLSERRLARQLANQTPIFSFFVSWLEFRFYYWENFSQNWLCSEQQIREKLSLGNFLNRRAFLSSGCGICFIGPIFYCIFGRQSLSRLIATIKQNN